jgi:hypothetical protein
MKGVGKVYPPNRWVLRDIYLSYFYGAKIGVLGLNGSGKSSLLKIMAGVDHDFVGEAFPARDFKVGYLPQEPELDSKKTVKENVMDGLGELPKLLKEFEEISAKFAEDMTPEEMEKDIVYDLQYHGGNKYKGWTVSKVKEEVSSYERALRKINPEKGISNLAKFDFKKVYADNFESSKSTVSELTSSDDGKGKGKGSDQFAKFPSAEAGFKAQRALWEKPFYSKKTIAEALKSWAPDATENYGKGIEKAIGVSIASTKFSDLSEAQKVALLNEQARQEGFFKPGSLPNRMNNPGAMKFASWETAYGAEPSGVGEGGKKVGSSQQLASNSKSAPSQENTTPKNQPGLNKYEKMSETELILSMFGDMFGDLSTSLFQLADASTKSSQKNGNSGDRVISDTVYNYDLIATEEGLRRVARGSN